MEKANILIRQDVETDEEKSLGAYGRVSSV